MPLSQPNHSPHPQGDPGRLQEHFTSHSSSTHRSRWESLWTESFVPWDRAAPNPALVDLLATRSFDLFPENQLRSSPESTRRPKALVPGCGRGYDVLLLAAEGYDATGLDFEGAIKAAETHRAEAEGKEEYAARDKERGRGKAEFVAGDFYTDTWVEKAGGKEGFDLIYDYTFFCAMPPDLRPKWAKRMVELLAPGGRLVCLEFPTYKDPKRQGPPWGVRAVNYVGYLSKPGEDLEFDDEGFVVGIDEDSPERNENGLIRIAHWMPERTHEAGSGTDWISVWRHQ